MTYIEFKNKYLGKKIDYDGSYGAQCWDLAAQYITECLGLPISIIAGVGLVNNLLKEPKLSLMKQYFDVVPLNEKEQGDIEVFDWGHIAIMDSWDSVNKVNNYLTQNSGTAENPVGGVYIGAIQDNPNCMAFRAKKMVSETDKLKEQIKDLQLKVTDLTQLVATKQKELDTSKSTISEKVSEIALKDEKIGILNNQITNLASNKDKEILELKQNEIKLEERLTNANSTIDILSEQKKELIEQYENKYTEIATINDKLEEDNSSLIIANDKLRKTLASTEKENLTLKKQLSNVNNEYTVLFNLGKLYFCIRKD